jgi:murein DD-endopeptidase MepM/ murein hydrolase activator NlpD
MSKTSLWAMLVVGSVLAGCDMALPPQSVPVSQHSGTAGQSCASSIVTIAGDTLYSVSRRCGVSVRDLIEANNLQPPYTLAPGTSLRMPGSNAEIVVGKGDTLLALARKNHVDFNSFAAANHKSPPYTIRLGEHLKLPGSFAPQPSALPPVSSGKPVVVTHALPPPVTPQNQPKSTSESLPSQALPPPVSPLPPPKPQSSLQGPSAESVVAPQPVAVVPPSQPTPAFVQPSLVTTKGFIWPVKGDVLLTFGPQAAKGQNNDGINIAAPRGTPIQAADSGTVAYVGNELKGFGNLVLIKHADGWVSAYAHAEQVMVRKGQQISKGQEIGTVGQTGAVNQPQLHFELRKQGEAVDPEEYLPG